MTPSVNPTAMSSVSKNVRWTLNCQQCHTKWNEKLNMIANPVLTETLKHHRSKLYYIIILLSVRKILSYLPTCAKKWLLGIYSQKEGRGEKTLDCKTRVFLSTITKKEKKKICKVQHVKGANKNNKNGNVAFRTSCGLIIRLLFEDNISWILLLSTAWRQNTQKTDFWSFYQSHAHTRPHTQKWIYYFKAYYSSQTI